MEAGRRLLDFACSFYPRLAKPTENFAYSPYSIRAAMALVSAGASGVTLREIQQAIHFPEDTAALHAEENALERALASRSHRPQPPVGVSRQEAPADPAHPLVETDELLTVTNDLWLAYDLHPESSLLNLVARHYGPRAHLVDFEAHPREAVQAINARIEEVTHGMLREVVPPGAIGADTRLVLSNALYFEGGWRTVFDVSKTERRPFFPVGGARQVVATMERSAPLSYVLRPDFTLVALPYTHDELEFVIIMPRAGTFAAFVRRLSAARLRSVLEVPRTSGERRLRLPKVAVAFKDSLSDALQSAGVKRGFTLSAEFGAWSGNIPPPLMMDVAFHAAKVAVDEWRTQAAAVTVIMEIATIAQFATHPPPILAIDHPFLFVIRDRPTGAILFMGQVVSLP